MRNLIRLILLIILTMPIESNAAAAHGEGGDVAAMERMTARLFPRYSRSFVYVKDGSAEDAFTIRDKGEKIEISGNNANSMAMGLNYYLKNYCHTTVSWYKDDPIELPTKLPNVGEAVSVKSKVPLRFFLNYCTFGYTMVWWQWADWERFIDWMALNGVNMPLAITGQEAIWYNVWKKLGLSDTQIRSYFTGPSFLPWQRMCNLDRWHGPLPMEWIESQAELQKQIVSRERELNMRPVLPAFAGHIPAELQEKYPGIKATLVSEWGGFSDKYRCTFLNPMDSMYRVIQKEYLTEQTRLYGSDHVYGVDPFNEVSPPTWDADSLGAISKHIYESLTEVDKEAVWLQMTWLFYADSEKWTNERIKKYVCAVPKESLLLLDYFCEYTEIWKRTEAYFGQNYIWCYLGNFGGNVFMSGPMKEVSERIDDAYKNGGSNLVGLGSTLEGLNVNQFMYEFVLDKAWAIPQSDKDWIGSLSDRRIGKKSQTGRKAWELLTSKVYVQPAQVGQGMLTNSRPCMTGFGHWTTKPTIEYSESDLIDAWRLMLAEPNKKRDSYKFDVVNIGMQVLGNYFMDVRGAFAEAYAAQDVARMQEAGTQMKELLNDIDRLAGCHRTFSLRGWIEAARAMGESDALKRYYEEDARMLVTIWGETKDLSDYSNRSWNGLIGEYYAKRWSRYIDEAIEAVKDGRKVDDVRFVDWSRSFENAWVTPDNQLTITEGGDGLGVARELYKKYENDFKKLSGNKR